MKRSKSLSSLPEIVVDMKLYNHGESGEWEETKSLVDDSGLQSNDGFICLEKKVDRLSDMCMEQNRVLGELMEHVRSTRRPALDDEQLMDALGELLQKLVHQRENGEVGEDGARSLLSAIEARPSLERRICAALADLLKSEDLKQSIVAATTASMTELVRSLFSVEVSSLYVPIMERSHRQLLKHVSRLVATAFSDLEENTACTAKALRKTSQSLEAALQRHQTLLEAVRPDPQRLLELFAETTETAIAREFKQWREEFPNGPAVTSDSESAGRAESPAHSASASPEAAPQTAASSNSTCTQFAVPTLSAVDRMMITAEINKLIKDGDLNGAFTKALLAMDLSLVVAACRAAAPLLGTRPAPVQPVLLSLLQQLATDLVLETKLKCSYIEYALVNLSSEDPVTRSHLPFVVEELNSHLAKFCLNYPHHALFQRITQIIVTARNLL